MGWGHVLGLLSLISTGAAEPADQAVPEMRINRTEPTPFLGTLSVVPRLMCRLPGSFTSSSSGSGVRISDNIVITARHVIQDHNTGQYRECEIAGRPVKLRWVHPHADLVAVEVELGIGYRAPYSCEGIKPGRRYMAIGHSSIADGAVFMMLTGTNVPLDKWGRAQLNGTAFPGMSGGEIVDMESGSFVAITVAKDVDKPWVWAVPLTNTYLCA
jgi:hypothetical protein